jgi:hypothetical protein
MPLAVFAHSLTSESGFYSSAESSIYTPPSIKLSEECNFRSVLSARNDRLNEGLKDAFQSLNAQIKDGKLESPCRSFTKFEYAILKSWSKARRVIGKAG